MQKIRNNIYNAKLKIDVNRQQVEADVNLSFFINSNVDSLKFYIYKDLEIDSIECNKNISYKVGECISNWSAFIEESKLINIKFKEKVSENNTINLNFKYKGKIDIVSKYETNRISKKWVELGLYSPWFPLFEDFRKCIFNVNIDITKGYSVLNAKRVGNIFEVENNTPSVDCTIIASNKFKKFNSGNINVYYIEDNQKDISYKLFSNVSKVMKLYSTFGKIESKNISIVNLPRNNGGGYCRNNLIVLNLDSEENDVDTFRFIAHELAHLWWNKACTSSFEDWLNESFAEFSALLAVREVYGEEEFNERISVYKRESENLPSIMDLNRQDEKAYECLYRKGPVILNEFMQIVGQGKFYEILMVMHRNNINTTEGLFRLIEKLTTRNRADEFKHILKEGLTL